MRLPFSPRIRWLLLVLACGTAVFLFFAMRMPSRMEVLSSPPQQKSRLAFLGRWQWPVKKQLHRIKTGIWGPPRTVQMGAIVAEFNSLAPFREFSLLSAVTNNEGDKVLIVLDEPAKREAALTNSQARVLSRPGVITVDGMQAQMSMTERGSPSGKTNAPVLETGFWLNVWPRVRSDGVGISCFFTSSEIDWRRSPLASDEPISEPFVRTNAALGAQIRVPTGASVVLISGATNNQGRVTGVYLTPTVQPKK
jgi:hypothetical protein